MPAKGNAHRRYPIHGDGVETLRQGFAELGMPPARWTEALAIVREVSDANDVVEFRWYKPQGTPELSCYWDDEPQNVLWVTASEVHVINDTTLVTRPPRPTDWQKQGNAYVGWVLPGADRGSGGGPRRRDIATVLCPETGLLQPRGSVCEYCERAHT